MTLRAEAQVFRPTSPQNLAISNEKLNEDVFINYVHNELIQVPIGGWKDKESKREIIVSRIESCAKLLHNINVFLNLGYNSKTQLGFGCGRSSMTRHYLTIGVSEHLCCPSMYGNLMTVVTRIQKNINSDLLAQYGWTVLKFRAPRNVPESIEVSWSSREIQAETGIYISPRDISYLLNCKINTAGVNCCEMIFVISDNIYSTHIGRKASNCNVERISDMQKAMFRYLRTVLGDPVTLKHICNVVVISQNQLLLPAQKPLSMLQQDFAQIVELSESCNFCSISNSYALLIQHEGHLVCYACRADDRLMAQGLDNIHLRGKLELEPRIYLTIAPDSLHESKSHKPEKSPVAGPKKLNPITRPEAVSGPIPGPTVESGSPINRRRALVSEAVPAIQKTEPHISQSPERPGSKSPIQDVGQDRVHIKVGHMQGRGSAKIKA